MLSKIREIIWKFIFEGIFTGCTFFKYTLLKGKGIKDRVLKKIVRWKNVKIFLSKILSINWIMDLC